jgi:hypothetical protein
MVQRVQKGIPPKACRREEIINYNRQSTIYDLAIANQSLQLRSGQALIAVEGSQFFLFFPPKSVNINQLRRKEIIFVFIEKISREAQISTIKDLVYMKYAGLGDEPKRIKAARGNPDDFRIIQQFTSEEAARAWAKRMLNQGYESDTSGKGWKYGYTFSIRR